MKSFFALGYTDKYLDIKFDDINFIENLDNINIENKELFISFKNTKPRTATIPVISSNTTKYIQHKELSITEIIDNGDPVNVFEYYKGSTSVKITIPKQKNKLPKNLLLIHIYGKGEIYRIRIHRLVGLEKDRKYEIEINFNSKQLMDKFNI